MSLSVLGALRRYQNDHGLIMTGRVDLRTRVQIMQDLS